MLQPDGCTGHTEIEIGDSCLMMADEHFEVGAYSPEHHGGSPQESRCTLKLAMRFTIARW